MRTDPKARPGKMPKDIYDKVMAAVRSQHPEDRIGEITRRRRGRVLVLSTKGSILLETDYKKARACL